MNDNSETVFVKHGMLSNGMPILNTNFPLISSHFNQVKGVYQLIVDAQNNTLGLRKQKNLTVYCKKKTDYDVIADNSIMNLIDSHECIIKPNDWVTNKFDENHQRHLETSGYFPCYSVQDRESLSKIRDQFETYSLLADMVADMSIRSLIVFGSAGIGKTYTIENALKKKKDENGSDYRILKGGISTVGFYCLLYDNREGVTVIDDVDAVLSEPDTMGYLKAATETDGDRVLSYTKFSSTLANAGIPQSFKYDGSLVFLTNTDMDKKGQKSPHIDAILTRSLTMNLNLTKHEIWLRVQSVMIETEVINHLNSVEKADVIGFLNNHHMEFNNMSIRSALLCATLRKAHPDKWKMLALNTLFKRVVPK